MRAVYEVTMARGRVRFSFCGGSLRGAARSEIDFPMPWAIITARNPGSKRLSEAENVKRDAALAQELSSRGLVASPAVNSAADGSWSEPGSLVLSLSRAVALAIGRRFGQRAIVWASGGKIGLLDCSTETWVVRPTYTA